MSKMKPKRRVKCFCCRERINISGRVYYDCAACGKHHGLCSTCVMRCFKMGILYNSPIYSSLALNYCPRMEQLVMAELEK